MPYNSEHRRKRRNSDEGVSLQLTSMMDMFTILLVFLLKSFSTSGQMINPSQDLTLPTSQTRHPAETGLDVTVSSDWILVNGRPVERTSEIQNSGGYILPKLQAALQQYAREGRRVEEQYGTKFSGKVTIQGDKHLSYRMLIKVLATCGQTDFPNMRLVVYQEEG